MKLTTDTKIVFHELAVHRRNTDYVIGYEKTGDYMIVEEEALHVIHTLHKKTIGETKKQHPDIDVEHLIEELQKKGLLLKIGHRVVTPHVPVADLLDIDPRMIKWLQHPGIHGGILGIFLTTILLLFLEPGLLPTASDFFFTHYYALLLPVTFITWWAIQFIHELAHYLMLRATGHTAGFSLVRKWHLLLPHANIESSRLLTKTQHLAVHLAGIGAETLLLVTAFMLQLNGIATPYTQHLAFITFISILFQTAPIKHTDLVRALEQRYGVRDLPAIIKKSIQTTCPFCKKRIRMSDEEEAIASIVFPYTIIGTIILAILFFAYILPIILEIISNSTAKLLTGAMTTDSNLFVDGTLTLIILTVFTSFYAVSFIREHHLGAKNVWTWTAVATYLIINTIVVFLLTAALLIFASPPTISAALLFIGLIYGVLFTKLLDHIKIEDSGFAKDLVLPVIAASSALLLMILATWLGASTGTVAASGIYGIAYATGMIAAIIF